MGFGEEHVSLNLDPGSWKTQILTTPGISRLIPNYKTISIIGDPSFMFILLEHYKLYFKSGLKEPACIFEETKKYRDDHDKIQEYIDTYLDHHIQINDALSLKDIWTHFKASEFYDKTNKTNQNNFKKLIELKLNITCEKRIRINGQQICSAFKNVCYKSQDKPRANELQEVGWNTSFYLNVTLFLSVKNFTLEVIFWKLS